MVKIVPLLSLLIVSLSVFSQGVYKGGVGDGHCMASFSNFQTSIKSKVETQIKVYPTLITETQEYINLKFPQLAVYQLEIFNQTGYLVLSSKSDLSLEKKINVSNLKMGVYVLRISSLSCQYQTKIIKVH